MSTCRLHATDDPEAGLFYRDVLRILNEARIPFLVAGTYALERHAALSRGTKDLDLFIVESDWPRVVAAMRANGVGTELKFSHWLGKAGDEERFVDFVFAGGNGMARVTPDWFRHGLADTIHEEPVLICAAEEAIWSKAFIMERERFDGADVLHMIRVAGSSLDWRRLVDRFDPHWPVLLAHLVLFAFVYPDATDIVPAWVRQDLASRYVALEASDERVCRGPLLSRLQYVGDLSDRGYRDARLAPDGNMTPAQIERWTAAALRESGQPGSQTDA